MENIDINVFCNIYILLYHHKGFINTLLLRNAFLLFEINLNFSTIKKKEQLNAPWLKQKQKDSRLNAPGLKQKASSYGDDKPINCFNGASKYS